MNQPRVAACATVHPGAVPVKPFSLSNPSFFPAQPGPGPSRTYTNLPPPIYIPQNKAKETWTRQSMCMHYHSITPRDGTTNVCGLQRHTKHSLYGSLALKLHRQRNLIGMKSERLEAGIDGGGNSDFGCDGLDYLVVVDPAPCHRFTFRQAHAPVHPYLPFPVGRISIRSDDHAGSLVAEIRRSNGLC